MTAVVSPTVDEFVSGARTFLEGVSADQDESRANATKSRYALFSGSTDDELSAAVNYQRAMQS